MHAVLLPVFYVYNFTMLHCRHILNNVAKEREISLRYYFELLYKFYNKKVQNIFKNVKDVKIATKTKKHKIVVTSTEHSSYRVRTAGSRRVFFALTIESIHCNVFSYGIFLCTS